MRGPGSLPRLCQGEEQEGGAGGAGGQDGQEEEERVLAGGQRYRHRGAVGVGQDGRVGGGGLGLGRGAIQLPRGELPRLERPLRVVPEVLLLLRVFLARVVLL